MFCITHQAPVKYLEFTAEKELNFVSHAFCTRQGGVSVGSFASLNVSAGEGDSKDHVRENFKIIAAAFGISPSQFLLLHQVHQDGVWVIDSGTPLPTHAPPRVCDAVVTDRPGLALCIKTADCTPIFLADPVRRVIGAVHAGWKGTALQIVKKAVGEMVRHFGGCPSDLVALIGPAIGPCCYEVDAVVREAMNHHTSRDFFFRADRQGDRWMLDLSLANRFQLLECGILPERIFTADHCTACHPELFFSHRAQRGDTGRQLNLIMLRKPYSQVDTKSA